MARAGLCSRREAERWISLGRVSLNGTVLRTPGVDVSADDRVLVDGQPLPLAEPARLWRYHKPRGIVTTHVDPQGRPTVFDSLPPELPRVISIGRLDFNTEGLLLLTNDGALARHLELPSTGWLRRYRVRANGRVDQAELDKLKDGIEIAGVRYGPVEATLDTLQGANIWLTLALREGKNREVRRILEHLGLVVNRLIRVSYGPFQLLDLEPGQVELVKRRFVADQIGSELADQLGLTGPEPDVQVTNRWRAESAALRAPTPRPTEERRPSARPSSRPATRPSAARTGRDAAPARDERTNAAGQRPRSGEAAARPGKSKPHGKVPQSATKRHEFAERRQGGQRRTAEPGRRNAAAGSGPSSGGGRPPRATARPHGKPSPAGKGPRKGPGPKRPGPKR